MKPELQRIAIAEACGWKPEKVSYGTCWTRPALPLYFVKEPGALPDYLSDLNAMNEAEKAVFGARSGYYDRAFVTHLCGVLGMDEDTGMHDKRTIYSLLHATAAQRAVAFLRTIGKWQD